MNGSFSEDSLSLFSNMVKDTEKMKNFSETSNYDFTRCVKPNGKAYGTSGQCKKGVEEKAPDLTPGARTLNALLKWGMQHERDSLTKEELKAVEEATPKQVAETLNEISKDRAFWKDLGGAVLRGFVNGLTDGL